ncbi:MAG: hypothetical protein H6Q88_1784 [Anaeromyxobacteraceae bacterium]|nr:hypothetical protein [Anaeromyxobacteraceae bacterium]
MTPSRLNLGMLPLHLTVLPACDPARFARLGAGLLAHGHEVPLLAVAGLTTESFLLGRHQRASSSVDLAAAAEVPVLRRTGGGRALLVGPGAVGLLVYTPPGQPLAPRPFPPDRTTNRYVRGLLGALRRLGAGHAVWFGRDFVTNDGRRVATVAQEGTAGGALLLEALIAVERDLTLPGGLAVARAHSDPRVEGPPPVLLGDLAGRAIALDEMAATLATCFGLLGNREPLLLEADLPEAEHPPAREDEVGLAESGAQEIPIGFLEALAGSSAGRLVGPRIRGDFIAPAETLRTLEASLEGAPLDPAGIGQRVDEAFHGPGAFLQGVTRLGDVARAVNLAGRAAAARTGVA